MKKIILTSMAAAVALSTGARAQDCDPSAATAAGVIEIVQFRLAENDVDGSRPVDQLGSCKDRDGRFHGERGVDAVHHEHRSEQYGTVLSYPSRVEMRL